MNLIWINFKIEPTKKPIRVFNGYLYGKYKQKKQNTSEKREKISIKVQLYSNSIFSCIAQYFFWYCWYRRENRQMVWLLQDYLKTTSLTLCSTKIHSQSLSSTYIPTAFKSWQAALVRSASGMCEIWRYGARCMHSTLASLAKLMQAFFYPGALRLWHADQFVTLAAPPTVHLLC